MLALIPISTSALFLEKSFCENTFVVSPSPAEGYTSILFCTGGDCSFIHISATVASSSLSSYTFTSPWQLLVCILGRPSMVPTLPTLICGDRGVSLI